MAEAPSAEIDISRPHIARMYDYYLGGKNHFAADRELAEKLLALAPTARTTARENRAFLGRAVRFLAAEAGVTQFLDIGTGLPTASSVHEVAQQVAPTARVVYADNDPLVLTHARALLRSAPAGRTAYIHADLRRPEEIVSSAVAAACWTSASRLRSCSSRSCTSSRTKTGPRTWSPPCSMRCRQAATWSPRTAPSAEVGSYGGVARKR